MQSPEFNPLWRGWSSKWFLLQGSELMLTNALLSVTFPDNTRMSFVINNIPDSFVSLLQLSFVFNDI